MRFNPNKRAVLVPTTALLVLLGASACKFDTEAGSSSSAAPSEATTSQSAGTGSAEAGRPFDTKMSADKGTLEISGTMVVDANGIGRVLNYKEKAITDDTTTTINGDIEVDDISCNDNGKESTITFTLKDNKTGESENGTVPVKDFRGPDAPTRLCVVEPDGSVSANPNMQGEEIYGLIFAGGIEEIGKKGIGI